MIRRVLTAGSLLLALATGLLWIWSYSFTSHASISRQGIEHVSADTWFYVGLRDGWLTASFEHGVPEIAPPDPPRAWWGAFAAYRAADHYSLQGELPCWEVVPALLLLPVGRAAWWALVRMRRRRAGPREQTGAGVWPRGSTIRRPGRLVRRMLGTLALVAALSTVSSYWLEFSAGTRDRHSYTAPTRLWLACSFAEGWLSVEMQRGVPMGGNFAINPGWYGTFADLSRPGSLYWWLMLPGWLLVVTVGVVPAGMLWIAALRRRRRRLSNACDCCGYCLTGNLSGACPECGANIEQSAASDLLGRILRARRRRKPLRAAALVLSLVAIASWGFTLVWTIGRVAPGTTTVVLGEGCLHAQRGEELDGCWDIDAGWFVRRSNDLRWEPEWARDDEYSSIQVPLWMVVLLTVVPTGLLRWYDGERLRLPP